MKNKYYGYRLLLIFLAIPFALLLVSGCAEGNKGMSRVDGGNSGAVGKLYSCPMHPEVQSSVPGSCPKCGMDLELARDMGRISKSGESGPRPASAGSGSSHSAHSGSSR